MEIAKYLDSHPKVLEVYYPYHPSHPQYDLARKQMKDGGGMVTFRLATEDQVKIDKFLNSFKIIKKAVSLGGVESLIEQPYTMTHEALTEEEKSRLGITRGVIRFSTGLEDVNDIIEELESALKYI